MLWTISCPFALCILLALSGLVSADDTTEKPCTIHDDGRYYDLNPLTASKDYEFKSEGGHLFVINVCKTISHETWSLKVDNPSEVAGFVRRDRGDFSIGTVNTTLSLKDSHPQITLSNGSPCKSGDQLKASTVIEFICDTSVFSAGKPRLVAQLPPDDDELACAYFIEWRTHFACPTGERGGPWGFFAILAVLLVILLMIYIVLGTLYNRFVLKLTGFDQIPQFSLTSAEYHARAVVDWVRDAVGGAYHGNGVGGSPGGVNPASHQAGVQGMGGWESERRRGAGAGRRTDLNPFSHQAQAGLGSPTSPPPTPPQQQQQPRSPTQLQRPPKRFDVESGVGASREEREFMLGGDADEGEGEEMADFPSKANDRPRSPDDDENSSADVTVADVRGRDLGSDGVIRL